jgi:hypothetical protein
VIGPSILVRFRVDPVCDFVDPTLGVLRLTMPIRRYGLDFVALLPSERANRQGLAPTYRTAPWVWSVVLVRSASSTLNQKVQNFSIAVLAAHGGLNRSVPDRTSPSRHGWPAMCPQVVEPVGCGIVEEVRLDRIKVRPSRLGLIEDADDDESAHSTLIVCLTGFVSVLTNDRCQDVDSAFPGVDSSAERIQNLSPAALVAFGP